MSFNDREDQSIEMVPITEDLRNLMSGPIRKEHEETVRKMYEAEKAQDEYYIRTMQKWGFERKPPEVSPVIIREQYFDSKAFMYAKYGAIIRGGEIDAAGSAYIHALFHLPDMPE